MFVSSFNPNFQKLAKSNQRKQTPGQISQIAQVAGHSLPGYRAHMSFGMAKLTDKGKEQLEVLHKKNEIMKEAYGNILKMISLAEKESPAVQSFVILSTNNNGNTLVNTALLRDQPEIAEKLIDFAEKQDEETRKKFILSTNNKGETQIDIALLRNQPEIAGKLIALKAKVLPEEIIKMKIPVEVKKSAEFSNVIENICTNEELTKEKTLKFLEENKEYIPDYKELKNIVNQYSQ